MDCIEKWFFPGTAIGTILRLRPMAISLLEKYAMDPWDSNQASIHEHCEAKRITLSAFLAEMKDLPEPEEDTDWKTRPIYHLVDHLAREHWEFLNRLLPAIKNVLAQEYAANAESLRRLRNLIEEWPTFSAALEAHIHQEEAFLFPKILQYDYSLRHKGFHPDFAGGTVDVYVALRMLGNEKEQMAVVRRFLSEVVFSKASQDHLDSLEGRLYPLLMDLQSRLANHAALEAKVLFPMAKSVEKALIDARISGADSEKSRTRNWIS